MKNNLHLMNGHFIDIGCGTAPYWENILKFADEYIGVDWKNSLHDQSNIDVFADLNKRLPFGDGYADTVISFQVMEHVPEPNIFLSECHSILKSGMLFIIFPLCGMFTKCPTTIIAIRATG